MKVASAIFTPLLAREVLFSQGEQAITLAAQIYRHSRFRGNDRLGVSGFGSDAIALDAKP